MYVLVRTDQSYGQIVVQTAHAAIEIARKYIPLGMDHPHLVICKANNIAELLAEKAIIDKTGIRSTIFYEEDIGGLATALASEPVYGEQRKHFKRWRLLK
jgi:peptidyl-tRNA hydrolase